MRSLRYNNVQNWRIKPRLTLIVNEARVVRRHTVTFDLTFKRYGHRYPNRYLSTMQNKILRTLKVFIAHYEPIPLEVYGNDSYKTLVSTLLSARTRDETTLAVCEKLFKRARNFRELTKLPQDELEKFLYPVGFYKTKAKNLKKAAQAIIEKHEGEVPDTITALIELPGIGRKTANLVLARAFGQDAISVDTHVHRVANTLGWVKTTRPEQTEKELMKIIPKNQWRFINKLLVSIGRQYRSKKQLTKFLEENQLLTISNV